MTASYKTEVQITPAPPEESTTKKSGFFGGIKKWFGGSSETTTVNSLLDVTTEKTKVALPTANSKAPVLPSNSQKPPPLVISNAPLVPLGPRPDTPSSSPYGVGPPQWPNSNNNNVAGGAATPTSQSNIAGGGRGQSPTQWPQPHPVGGVLSTSTTMKPLNQQNTNNVQTPLPRPGGVGQPQLPPGFGPYQPPKSQPSGLDLSYGGSFNAGRPQPAGKPGIGLVSTSSSTTTSTASTPIQKTPTTPTPRPQQLDFDLRGEFDKNHPAAPASTKPSIKEDFPALPTAKSPSATPASPSGASTPSAWNKPLPSPVGIPSSGSSTTTHSPLPKNPIGNTNGGVSFVPHVGTTTTLRPGFQNAGSSVATDDEIRSLTETLYTKETNGQMNLITVQPQGKTRSIDSTDEAPQP